MRWYIADFSFIMFVFCFTTFSLLFTDHWTLPIAFQTSIDQYYGQLCRSETLLESRSIGNILYKIQQDKQERNQQIRFWLCKNTQMLKSGLIPVRCLSEGSKFWLGNTKTSAAAIAALHVCKPKLPGGKLNEEESMNEWIN